MEKLQSFSYVKEGYTQFISKSIVFSPSLTYLANFISLIGICFIAIKLASVKIKNKFS
tara:strand:+ start:380 stop:553 length:174 start_codon:yes stop_codon:yes gene_type:complete